MVSTASVCFQHSIAISRFDLLTSSFASFRGGLADFNTVTAVNFGGVLNVTKAFLPLLNPDGGRIVNMSSSAGTMYVGKCSAENQVFNTMSHA